MNIKTMTVCLVCAGALLVSCGSNREKKAGDTDEMEKPEMIGGDKDEHGCIASAGYTWSEVQKDCIRLWEKGVRLTSVKDERNTLYIVFSPDSSRVELFFSEEDIPNEILDRRSLPSGGYVWNMEDDDTKNVRLENDKWTVSRRGELVYESVADKLFILMIA